MMEKLQLKKKHFFIGQKYTSNTHCPLAMAAREYFGSQDVAVGAYRIDIKDKITEKYENTAWIEEGYWETMFEEDVKRAQLAEDPEKVIREFDLIIR